MYVVRRFQLQRAELRIQTERRFGIGSHYLRILTEPETRTIVNMMERDFCCL